MYTAEGGGTYLDYSRRADIIRRHTTTLKDASTNGIFHGQKTKSDKMIRKSTSFSKKRTVLQNSSHHRGALGPKTQEDCRGFISESSIVSGGQLEADMEWVDEKMVGIQH